MMDQDKNYITPGGMARLRDEYSRLMNNERPKVVETVAWAASNGDRSENADYIYGKRRLREIDGRLRFLTQRLERAVVIDPATVTSQKVVFGATVTIINEDGNSTSYQIVGEDESDIKSGKVSWKAPLAAALLGKKEGDEVILKKPTGEEVLSIERIEYK